MLFLDADAYCIADPALLFALLAAHPFVYFDSGPWSYPKTNLALFGPLVEAWAPPIQGGHYLVDCAVLEGASNRAVDGQSRGRLAQRQLG